MSARIENVWPQHVARRMTDLVHNEVKAIVASSRLTRTKDAIALVKQEELHIGRLLGQGAFSEVHEVKYNKHDGKTYAMKHLKGKLMSQPDNFRLAAAELAVEAHMLASFEHPNIIKVRGWAANGVASFATGKHDSFFLLLDRLDETLDRRIDRWLQLEARWRADEQADSHVHSHGVVVDMWRRFTQSQPDPQLARNEALRRQPQKQQRDLRRQHQEQVLLEKLGICMEISSALSYLHSQGVIFRDLKPNNIGFLNGRVKLFDFGLSRELPHQSLEEPFEMSGKVGTLRYMAVEVACHHAYNVSADVYSWAMVSYEVLRLQKPFAGWTRDMHSNLVCGRGVRPELVSRDNLFSLSPSLRSLLEAAWCQHAHRRPCMLTVCHKMQQLEQEQLLSFHDLLREQQENVQTVDDQNMVVELPQDFSIVRKAPGHVYSDTSGTVSVSMGSLTSGEA